MKNTFIELAEEEDAGQFLASALHRNGARTCTARLAEEADNAAPFFPPAAQLPSVCCDAVDDVSTTADDASTTAPSIPASPDTPRLGSADAPRSKVMLQIPLEVESGFLPMVQEVCSATFDATTGRLSLDLRVVLGPWPAATLPAAVSSMEVLPVPAARAAVRKRAPAHGPGAEKSQLVCCHWKNKGWCRYQDTCKFQHPEHKRGVGSAGDHGKVSQTGQPCRRHSTPGGL